jgi:AbrB family looped-hinge helix DNA binding protein
LSKFKNDIDGCQLAWHYANMTAKITIGPAGRLVIPKAVRDSLHLAPGDTLELESADEKIVLRPVRQEGTMRKERGMWVFYGGSGKPITQAETDAVLDELREERHRQILGET